MTSFPFRITTVFAISPNFSKQQPAEVDEGSCQFRAGQQLRNSSRRFVSFVLLSFENYLGYMESVDITTALSHFMFGRFSSQPQETQS